MNVDLTINSLSFKQASNSKAEGSERRETSRGVNLPEVLTIRHMPYVDKSQGIVGVRSVLRLDRYVALLDGRIRPVSCYVTTLVPSDANIGSTDVQATVTRLQTLLQPVSPAASSGLYLPVEIFTNREQ